MSLIHEADLWAGKTLFVPIIVRICQGTGQNQYAVARWLWLSAGLWILYHAEGWLDRVLIATVCLLLVLTTGLRAKLHHTNFIGYRVAWWANLLVGLLSWVIGKREYFPISELFILFGEYAVSIINIPPLNKAERRSKAFKA
jgi:hypothetical protein